MILLECNVSLVEQLKGGEKVKKMSRPYFETKVVKVKKPETKPKPKILMLRKKIRGDYKYKKVNSNSKLFFYRCGFPYRINDEVYCYDDKRIWRIFKIIEPKKGNWINGENLDKIKFQCFCSYSDGEGSERKKGFLSMNRGYYYIADITNQKKVQSDFDGGNDYTLKALIVRNNIHIIKGKIIIFEEE